MSTINENRPGYKKTKVGWVPEDWEIKLLGNLCQINGRIGYRGYTRNDIVDKGKGAITVSPSNIQNNKLNLSNNTYISWFKYDESPEIQLEKKDILLVKTGSTYGKTALVEELPEKATINPQLVIIKKVKCSVEFLSYLTSFSMIQKQIESSVVGGAIPTLSQESISKFKIPLPPLPEQKKIAAILSTWDAAIRKLDRLIERKQTLKKGLMQQLLTGRRRFPEFVPPGGTRYQETKLGLVPEDWEVLTIGQLGKVVSGGTPRTGINEYWNGSVNWFTPSEITSLKGKKHIKTSLRKVTLKGIKNSSATLLPKGSIIVCTRATIGIAAILAEEGTTNQGFKNLIPNKKMDVDYLYYQIISSKNRFLRKSAGSTFLELSTKDFKSFKLVIPTFREQQSISQVLSICDNQIEKLKEKKQKLEQQKKGLMQQLLTGAVRVRP